MRIEGEYTFGAPQQRVWDILLDPNALSRALPGVEQFRQVGPNEYEATVHAGVAAVRGSYHGHVTMADLEPPERYTLAAKGQGSGGTFDATARITLIGQDGRTQLRYEADAQVGGPVAGVGQRMLGGVAKLMANQFFKAMETQLVQGTDSQPAPAQAAASAPVSTTPAPTGLPFDPGELLGLAGPVGPWVAAALVGLVLGVLVGRRGGGRAEARWEPRAGATYALAAALHDLASAIREQRRR